MASISFAATGRLQVLRDSSNESQDGVDIVLVPGIGTTLPEEWPFVNKEWLATLPGSSAGTRILAYDYTSPFGATKPSWESMLMLGHDLIQHISDVRSSSVLKVPTNKPILVVCHSLGGIIVKQALCVADKQFRRYESIINAIAGVIFLSTPHRYGDKTTSCIRFRDVFEATTSRHLEIPSMNIEQEGAILLDLADRFEGISFSAPILSAYELRESKTSSTTLHHKYQQLVNREACSTRAQMETVIGLNLNHHDTCLFTQSIGGESLPELNEFLSKTLQDAARLIALRLEDREYQDATTSTYSPTMSEIPLKVEQLELTESPSNKATAGTSLSGFELVSPITPKSDVAKPLHLPCLLLNTHSANEDFCGREDILERLATELLPPKNRVTASGTALRQFALCGFGGIGKTEIAREFARRHKHSFDAVFWVVADEIAKLDHHYQYISLVLGLEEASESWYQKERRQTKKFNSFFETTRSIYESSTHPDRDSLLTDIHFYLGAIAIDTSNFDISRINKEYSFNLVSKIYKELGTTDDRLYLAYAERGISRIQDRRYKEGEANLKEALRIRKDLQNYIPRAMINDALEIWSVDSNAHKNEIARTTFLKGKLLSAMGKMQKASIAFRVACRLRKEITKEDRDLNSLTMIDFDEIVAFWAR
ncbi:hypothetical protein N7516_009069 [Penicillium verrucosum]|uniref:uncharacterized protein n=1 Tax=Penicillium verrucosum TaxID=60171 RepID=UPI002545041E|nr:uncharacterized protein N7516_009069 [Penicillium verrucosum]KAJ5927296.1 hypothetical protein N7516_009069 [Penicillium verrucosum]